MPLLRHVRGTWSWHAGSDCLYRCSVAVGANLANRYFVSFYLRFLRVDKVDFKGLPHHHVTEPSSPICHMNVI